MYVGDVGFLSKLISSGVSKAATSATSAISRAATSKSATSAISRAATSATSKGATSAISRAATSAISKAGTSLVARAATAASPGLFSSIGGAISSNAGTLLETYLALQSAQTPLAPDMYNTGYPLAPGQPDPGNYANAANPAFVQPQPFAATGLTNDTINVLGVRTSPLLLIGGAALITFFLMRREAKT